MQKKRVLVGMSGGVDSSVAAILLIRQGFEVVGCTLQLHSEAAKDARDAAAICEKLGIEHHILNFSLAFEEIVVNDFIKEYLAGNTPNPCVVCNRYIKFEKMLEAADSLGCEYIATGHYAVIKEENGRFALFRPEDLTKDQTYVLYRLTQSQIARTLMPLATTTKEQVREIAREYGLVCAEKKDSQDICFVPDGDYARFIENHIGSISQQGDFIDCNGQILGKHNGMIRYTVGQRKGLGIALGKPAFVIKKDAQNNQVTLDTDESLLFYKKVLINQLNYISFDTLPESINVQAKLRYRHNAAPAVLKQLDNGCAVLEFEQPQRAPSPGQSAVFYDGDRLIGGGIIVKGISENE